MSKTNDAIKDFQPQWKNKHENNCPVTQQRADLWAQFVKDPTSEGLYGAVIEYDGFGDQETENCTCYVCGSGEAPEHFTGEELWMDARTLALAIEGFIFKVARDTNTHDGQPRGMGWVEHHYLDAGSLTSWAKSLRGLADLWEDG
jgi:hypothetical protein